MKCYRHRIQNGQGLIEYAIILAFIAVVVIAVLLLMGPTVGNVFSEIVASLQSRQSEQVADETAGGSPIVVRVIDQASQGIPGVTVYAFDGDNHYLGMTGVTGADGAASLTVERGTYRFRADYQSRSYWSDAVLWPDSSEARIETGQAPFTVNVVNSTGGAISDVQVQAFTADYQYTGVSGLTDALGQVVLNLAGGDLSFQAFYQEQEFWSSTVTLPEADSTTIEIDQQLVTIRVVDAAGAGIADVIVDTYSGLKSFIARTGTTDQNGEIVTRLADGAYYFRASYQTRAFWSPLLSTPAENSAVIETGQSTFTVLVTAGPSEGVPEVPVYAFTGTGDYVGIGGLTDASGQAQMRLAAGDYKFRADVQGQQFWSQIVDLAAGSVEIVTGSRTLTVKVEDAAGNGISDQRVYAFTAEGGYLGISDRTDRDGLAVFELTAGNCQFRVDYQYKEFWSPVVNPAMGSTSIQTGQRPFTVHVQDRQGDPIRNARVWVYTGDGDYIDLRENTDSDGDSVFDLSNGDYLFRARVGGTNFWSDIVNSPGSSTVTIVAD